MLIFLDTTVPPINKLMKKIISSSIFVFLISSVSLRSEVLLLKSGKQVVGNIINQDKETVTFKLTDGTTKVFQKSVIRKISFTKIADPIFKKEEISKNKEETQGKKEAAALAEKQKSKKKSFEERKQELINSKRHHLEVSFGFGNGAEQSELRPFYQTIQYAGLAFSSSGQAEILTNPYKTPNNGSTTRIQYAWNRFTFELRGTEAKHNIDVNGFQTLAFGTGGSNSSGERAVNVIFGNANTKFQKVSSRIGFTPYPHPILDLQILGGVERIWTSTSQEVDSLGPSTASGINPSRISFREYSSHHKGYSFGIGFEWKFLKRFVFQEQILHLDMASPSSFKNYEYRVDGSNATFRINQVGLDYWWKSTGTEINFKLSAKVKGNWSVFVETSNMTLKNTLQTGYISDNDANQEQIGLKIFGPKILIPMLYESKTILTYIQLGVNYRFNF
ncbi:hypothetical protein ISU82_05960 [Leptospira borgpetersenii serovar Balcanica]|nr:hypothetical protein [Leptospira borgpetersenii]MBE8363616.1 hypothetical protein [Leptospira borgpetersenii serovar Balcanica]MBE8368296.1 hypothetical protein [Leptospira borgpetersenii serovar Balcanica]MBE8422634.1 hypothetical protein [Leptospira borgpetersenii serovar Balcanica]MBF3349745.1 hypothetical protein [Leptospira borgpetersenii serovar Balcanica]